MNSRSASARIRSGVSVSERIVWRILAANSAAPSRPSPSLAGRTTSRRWVSNAARAARAVAAAADRRGHDRRDAVVRRRRGVTGCERLRDELLDPAVVPERGLGLEAADGAPGSADERLTGSVEHRRHRLQPAGGGRQPVRERRELARVQGEQPVAQQIDPDQRVPGVLVDIDLLEARRLELADQQVAVDRFVSGQPVASPRTRPASGRRRPAARHDPPAERSGQRPSWACSPIVVAKVGCSRKYSSRKASTRVEKSDIGQV